MKINYHYKTTILENVIFWYKSNMILYNLTFFIFLIYKSLC